MTGQFEPQGASAALVVPELVPQGRVAVVFGTGGGIGGALIEPIRAAGQFEHLVASLCHQSTWWRRSVSNAPLRTPPIWVSFGS